MSDPSDSTTDPVVVADDAVPAPTPAVAAPDVDATESKPESESEEAPKDEPAAPTDPVEISLPDEDDAELAFHKATIIAEEDIREAVTIPSQFAAKYLWSPLAPSDSSSSTRLPGAHPENHVVIPPSLLADTHAAMSTALSTATQLASLPAKPAPLVPNEDGTMPAPPDPPAEQEALPEPIITLFAPYDNTAGVIDTIVSGVGQSQRADVLVLDALMFAQGEAGPLGSGLEKFLKTLYRVGESMEDDYRERQVQRYLRALIDVQLQSPEDESKPAEEATSSATYTELESKLLEIVNAVEVVQPESKPAETEVKVAEEANPTEEVKPADESKPAEESAPAGYTAVPTSEEDSKSSTSSQDTKVKADADDEDEDGEEEYSSRPRPRIIYLKDFGGIASLGQPLLKALILAVRSRRLALQPSETDSTPSSSTTSSDSEPPTTWEGKKIQPTVIILGVSHSPEASPHNCCSSCTWTKFQEGFESSDPEKLCQLLPDVLQPVVSKSTDDIAKVVADALFTVPKRVSYSEKTFVDPDVGSGAIYKQIICAYGFYDKRDPLVKPKKSDSSDGKKSGHKGKKEPDESLWRKGKATTQRERKEEFGVMRLSRNELVVRKALSALGGSVPDGQGIFSALPEEDKSAEEAKEKEKEKEKAKGKGKENKDGKKDKKKSKKKTAEELEAEKYTTIVGLKENLLTRTVADRIAAIALHGLPTTSLTPLKPKLTSIPGTPKSGDRIVSPEDIAAAIKASLIGNDQRKKWFETMTKIKDAGDTADSDKSDDEDDDEKEKKEDPILAKVRNSGTLNSHEERLIGGVIDTTQLATGFEDVCIDPKIVDSVRMIISLPLLYPKAFASGILGAEALSGILLYGPPGTGKTMLCRAVAKECNVRMLLVAPSNVQDMYVGETEKLVKAIFTLARKIAPCVIFIDEVDAIFGARSSDNTNGSRYHRSMLTEFMQEMDGLNSASVNKKKGIVVIGATNRPFDLDDAVLRRLPRRMLLDLPGPKEREAILKVHLKGETMEGIDLTDLARRTNNFSGSDLKNLAVSAALASLKDIIPDMWNAKKTITVKGKGKGKAAEGEEPAESKESDEKKPTKDDDDEEDEDSDSDSDSDDDETPDIAPRILRPIHFKAAFEQVSATCSRDMASVQKLRNWAAQFSRDSGAGLGSTSGSTASTTGSPLAGGHAHTHGTGLGGGLGAGAGLGRGAGTGLGGLGGTGSGLGGLGRGSTSATSSTTSSTSTAGTGSSTTGGAGGSTSPTTTTTTGSTYRGLANGDGIWDRYESNMLSRFSNLPRPGASSGAGSSGAGGSGAAGASGGATGLGRGAGAGGSGAGAGSGAGGSGTGTGTGTGTGSGSGAGGSA